jgi:hypothetical protein
MKTNVRQSAAEQPVGHVDNVVSDRNLVFSSVWTESYQS